MPFPGYDEMSKGECEYLEWQCTKYSYIKQKMDILQNCILHFLRVCLSNHSHV